MLTLDMTSEERELYEHTLVSDHWMNIRVDILDLNHNHIQNISHQFLDGQVTISAGADLAVRKLSMDFLDPFGTLGFDTRNPSDGILFADRMLQVFYEVYVPELQRTNKWISMPVFTGPVTGLDRSGNIVQVTGSSKEVLAGPIWKTWTIPKNTLKVEAIRDIMRRAGEGHYKDLGNSTSKLGKAMTTTNETAAWSQAEDIAQGMNLVLYYDPWGELNLKETSTTSVYTFRDGNGGSILEDPEITYNPDTVTNVIKVVGKKGSKSTPSYTAYPEPSHPISPESLGRIDDEGTFRPSYRFEIIQNDTYNTKAACETQAKKSLQTRLDESVELKFDSLPIPHIEPNDMCTIVSGEINMDFKLRTLTLPLNSSGKMTVGYTKNQIINKTRIRNRIL